MTQVKDNVNEKVNEVGHVECDAQPYLARLILRIREWCAQRNAAMRMQFRIENQARAYVRRLLGFQTDMEEKERAAIEKQVEKIIKALVKGQALDGELGKVAAVAEGFVGMCWLSRVHPVDYEASRRKKLEKAAIELPVWPWVEAIRGFGALGLAIIVGECADLSNYANPAKVWKRMGLAVIDGKRQRKCLDKLDAELHGYNPLRRSAMWKIGDSLIKGNNGGEYYALYVEHKEKQLAEHEGMTKLHAHRRAKRFMEKRLLRDLWRAWRDTQ